MHQLFMLPGQSAEEQRRRTALLSGERLLHGFLEVMCLTLGKPGFGFQTRAFFRESLLDNIFQGGANLDQVGGSGGFGFEGLSAHSCTFPRMRPSCRFNRLKEIGIHLTARWM